MHVRERLTQKKKKERKGDTRQLTMYIKKDNSKGSLLMISELATLQRGAIGLRNTEPKR